MPSPDLSIVIVSYNTRQLLLNCLTSIYATPALPVEVIVVDNNSGDGSVDAMRAAFPQVIVIANAHNAYFSAANNQGFAAASGRYLLAMNPDMVVRGDALRQLVRQMDADPRIGAATTAQFLPDGRRQHNGSRHVTYAFLVVHYTFIGKLLARRNQALKDWLWYADWDRASSRDVEVLPGSCILARRELWRDIGGFDESMPMYFSDDYFSWQVQRRGLRTVFLLSDGIVHYEGQSARQVSQRALRLYMHDLLAYTRLRFGRIAQIALALLLIPTVIVQTLRARR